MKEVVASKSTDNLTNESWGNRNLYSINATYRLKEANSKRAVAHDLAMIALQRSVFRTNVRIIVASTDVWNAKLDKNGVQTKNHIDN
jgi:hypothetical protein